jgi:hypothetical protein
MELVRTVLGMSDGIVRTLPRRADWGDPGATVIGSIFAACFGFTSLSSEWITTL